MMPTDEPNRLQAIEALRAASYTSFNDRRVFELKLSLSIWAALAVVIVGMVQPLKDANTTFPIKSPCSILIAFLIAVAITLLHGYWSNGASRSNSVDRGFVVLHLETMRKELNIPIPDDLQLKINRLPPTEGWRQWSHLSQILITFVLASTCVLVFAARVFAGK